MKKKKKKLTGNNKSLHIQRQLRRRSVQQALGHSNIQYKGSAQFAKALHVDRTT